jgi:hypothetical protein
MLTVNKTYRFQNSSCSHSYTQILLVTLQGVSRAFPPKHPWEVVNQTGVKVTVG